MYRCIECGSEYDTKPDFCECGNDTFVEEVPETNDFVSKKSSYDKKNMLSWIIFIICVLLSVLILIFFPKIDTQNKGPEQEELTQVIQEDIPELYSFWIDCKPQKDEEVEASEPVKVIMSIIKPKTEPKKDVKKENQVKNTSQKTQQSQAAIQTKRVQQTPKPKTQQTSQTQTSQTEQTVLQYELLTYKNSLLQRLRSNIPFSEIEGDGECGIVFALDSSGKLTDRNFYFQSDNKSVNDAVYKMLMKTPRFNPPPSGYKGEKLKIYLKLGSNQYEMRYVN